MTTNVLFFADPVAIYDYVMFATLIDVRSVSALVCFCGP